MVHGQLSMGHGLWTVEHGPWSMPHGPWTMDHGCCAKFSIAKHKTLANFLACGLVLCSGGFAAASWEASRGALPLLSVSTHRGISVCRNPTGSASDRVSCQMTRLEEGRLLMFLWPWPPSMDRGPWTMVHGPWSLDHGARAMDHGPWSMVHGPWSMDH